jgi:hypothetical protein
MMKHILAAAMTLGFAMPATPALAQTMDHSAHAMSDADHSATMDDDVSGAEAMLLAYRNALTARDAQTMAALDQRYSSRHRGRRLDRCAFRIPAASSCSSVKQ